MTIQNRRFRAKTVRGPAMARHFARDVADIEGAYTVIIHSNGEVSVNVDTMAATYAVLDAAKKHGGEANLGLGETDNMAHQYSAGGLSINVQF